MKSKAILLGLVTLTVSWAASAAGTLSESFDDVTTLGVSGWVQTNNSTAGGTTGWFQGNPLVFTAASGAPAAYIGANFDNAPTGGNVSNWLITPMLDLDSASKLDFAVRAAGFGYLDILEVRLSTQGASANVGATDTSVGDFTTLLGSYTSTTDEGWVPLHFDLGLGGPTSGRLAFRYVIADTSVNGNYLGIDSVQVVPEPAAAVLALLGLVVVSAAARRSRR
jgi:hypothetical protein